MTMVGLYSLSSICCLVTISIVTGLGNVQPKIGGTYVTFGTNSLTISTKEKTNDDHGRVVVTFKSIKEVDENDTKVGVNDTHKVPSVTGIQVDGPMKDTYDNVSRTYFHAIMNVSVGEMNLTVSVYTQNGTVSEHTGNGTVDVRIGMVEVRMMIGEWTFCGCVPQIGMYLDLDAMLKGNGTAAIKQSDGYSYQLGNGALAIVKTSVAVDSVSNKQPSNYPKVTDSMFTFRAPKFGHTAEFQFFVEVIADDNGVSNAIQQRPLSVVVLLIAACLIHYTCH